MDCSSPGSSVHGISHVIILEWVAISFPRESFWPRHWTCVSCMGRQILYQLSHKGSPRILEWVVFLYGVAHQAPLSMKFSRQEYWSGLPCPFPGDPPNSEIEMGLLVVPAPQAIYLPLSHRGSPYPFKR